ncbi:MAG: hypothetical protein GC181_09765 [Bacteroidetes bacterium]|nr:hypothetical protein [Bacteroidota bacterium]
MKTIDITNHFTEYDRSVLVGDNAYEDYFEYVRFALNSLLSSIPQIQSDNPYEISVLQDFAQRFLNTIEAFGMKYAFSEDQPMLVDTTESGFPNFLEFKRLNDDIEKRQEKLHDLPAAGSLKNEILDTLIRNKTHPQNLLKQMSRVQYYTDLYKKSHFTEFSPGRLQLIKNLNDAEQTRRFMYSWASFDSVTNRPFVYLLVFDNPMAGKVNRSEDKLSEFFEENIRHITHNSAPLKVIASDIDNGWESIKPKILKRTGFGPIYGHYSMDEHPFTKLLKDEFERDDFIFTYESELIFSTGERKSGSFLSKGELRQIFYVDDANKECIDRMVSKVFRYMITSHRVLQHLNSSFPEELKKLSIPPYIYTRQHGEE